MNRTNITSPLLEGTIHGFFTKQGGVSKGIYESLNCGFGSNDKKKNIKKNREVVSRKLKIKEAILINGYQTHSSKIKIIDDTPLAQPLADGLITMNPNIALTVLTADCAPILLYDCELNIVGAIHAGWKGVLNGIIENTVKKLRFLGSSPENIKISIGPTIGPKSFEVGKDLKTMFAFKDKQSKLYFKSLPDNKYLFDLNNYIIKKFNKLGIKKTWNSKEDTFTNPGLYFSCRYNKKRGITDYGRMLSVIKLKN